MKNKLRDDYFYKRFLKKRRNEKSDFDRAPFLCSISDHVYKGEFRMNSIDKLHILWINLHVFNSYAGRLDIAYACGLSLQIP